jgi:type I restriction enzyme, S subunit
MTTWKEYKLGELNCKFLSGFAFKSSDYITNGIPLIKIGNIQNRIVSTKNSVNYVSKDLINSKTDKFLLKNRDVLIAMTGQGSVGRVGRLSLDKGETAFLNQRVGKFLCDEVNLNIDYLYYVFSTPEFQKILFDSAAGSGQPNLSPEIILNTKIPYLDYNTQSAIAEILSSLDDKIELNNKINQELENLAQTLFKQWFIDFEFPDENGNPYKSSGGEMVDSELGEIPKGWEVKKLNEFVNCFDSKRVPLSSQQRALRSGVYPYYGAASLMDYIDDYLFDGVYLLMGEDGSVTDASGYPVLQYVFGQFWVNNHAHVLQGTTISTELVMCLLKNTNISHLVTGAVQPKLNQGNMNKISLAIPKDANILSNLEINVKSIYESVRNNTQENQELTSLRDTLLPKLISGQLEVTEVMSQKV